MAEIRLQFSVICKWSDGKNIGNIINGLTPGKIDQFYIVNKWIWDEQVEENLDGEIDPAGYYQETRIIESGKEERILALSRSDSFRVKSSHLHNNCLRNLTFHRELLYRVRVELFNSQGEVIKSGSIDYPLFVV